MTILGLHERPRLLSGCLLLLIGSTLQSIGIAGGGLHHANACTLRQAVPGYSYQFPHDHGSHDEFRTEWWYYTGHLVAGDGRRFGYELTFFRRRVDKDSVTTNPSRWAIRHLYLAHFALSDHGNQTFRYAEKASRAGLGKAGAETGQLHVWIDRWVAEQPALHPLRHHLEASAETFSIHLDLDPQKLPIVHGEDGVSRKGKGPTQASHYYSLTRMATTGNLTVGPERLSVTGMSWMDHEFGSGDLGEDQIGWDWFSAQLNNQTEIMLYLLRRPDGTVDPVSSGTFVLPDGQSQHLSLADFQVEPLDHWKSTSSGASYPSRWRISIPSVGLILSVTPKQADQELITERSTQITYWEGAVAISGGIRNIPLVGDGYIELTGYAQPFSQRSR